MMKGFMVDDNMSNLSCASGEISASSSSRNESAAGNFYYQQSSASIIQAPPPPLKKKRNLPGNPGLKFGLICNPSVILLSFFQVSESLFINHIYIYIYRPRC